MIGFYHLKIYIYLLKQNGGPNGKYTEKFKNLYLGIINAY